MGLYDRDYTKFDYQSHHGAPQMQFRFPRLTPVVKWLLIINVAVFLLTFMITPLAKLSLTWFSVYPVNIGTSLQLWRLITYQFLHDTNDFGHIFVNMLILFFFGPMLERLWGSKKFLTFFLICGAMGGIFYPFLTFVGWLQVGYLIGASGAILGMLAAGAILFPRMRVWIFGIFPIPMMFLASIFALISIMTLLRPDKFANAGGQAAHLAGMVTGALYVVSDSYRAKFKMKFRSGKWQKNIENQQNLQLQVDRILQKVHQKGIHSLTAKEKRILKKATREHQKQNHF